MKQQKTLFFASQHDFRQWLLHHHQTESELIVGFWKKNSGKPSMSWSESVDQALCFGWIDGVRRSIDNESYSVRFTPRRPQSIWSTINIDKVNRLIAEDLMMPAGHKAFSLRKEERSSVYSFENKAVELSAEMLVHFANHAEALQFFNGQAPSYRKTITYWVMTAKQESTRLKRLEKLISASKEHKRLR